MTGSVLNGQRGPIRSGCLVQLHGSDLLHAGMPDMAELERRAERDRRSRMLVWLRNPMAMRFPLLDPDRALDRVVPLLRALPWRLIGGAVAGVGGDGAWCLPRYTGRSFPPMCRTVC